MTPFKDEQIKETYSAYAAPQRNALLAFRELIFQAANENERIGEVQEALKWGQPSFLTKTGSTIRIDKIKDSQDVAMYFICTTHLVDRFREIYPTTFNYVKGRSLYFELNQPYDEAALKHCITMALTHKLKH